VAINLFDATTNFAIQCNLTTSVVTAGFISLDVGFFCFIWGSGVFVENLIFFTLVKSLKCMLYYCIFHSPIQLVS